MISANLNKSIKLFWDIDGTILQTNGAAAVPFATAVSDFAGQKVIIDRKKMSGFTDYEIANYLLESVKIEASLQDITIVLENYAKNLPNNLRQGKVQIIGNVLDVLRKLKSHPDIELAIATGNFILGAKAKLNQVGLIDYFQDKDIFCASEVNWTRDLIIQSAKNSLKPGQTGFIIGDSPKDVYSAKNSKLKVIAVATGAHSLTELSYLNPDYLLTLGWGYEDLMRCIEI